MESAGDGDSADNLDQTSSDYPKYLYIFIEEDSDDTPDTAQTVGYNGQLLDLEDTRSPTISPVRQPIITSSSALTNPDGKPRTASHDEKEGSDNGGKVVPEHSESMSTQVLGCDSEDYKQRRGSTQQKEHGRSLDEANFKEKEVDRARSETELACDYATLDDHNLLKAHLYETEKKLDELTSKLEAVTLHALSFSTSSNEATKSTKKKKRGPNSRYDKTKNVRVCQLCPEEKPFADKDNRKVREHIFDEHNLGKSYDCPNCKRNFRRSELLKSHLKICPKK